jgi:hypothetical protein
MQKGENWEKTEGKERSPIGGATISAHGRNGFQRVHGQQIGFVAVPTPRCLKRTIVAPL